MPVVPFSASARRTTLGPVTEVSLGSSNEQDRDHLGNARQSRRISSENRESLRWSDSSRCDRSSGLDIHVDETGKRCDSIVHAAVARDVDAQVLAAHTTDTCVDLAPATQTEVSDSFTQTIDSRDPLGTLTARNWREVR
jgi:hypothetical protein